MQDFFEFYQFGGMFNNVVSLFGLAALAAVVLHSVGPRRTGIEPALLRLADRLAALGVAAGLLGSLFGIIELSTAVGMISADLLLPAMATGIALVPIPLVWSLMCAIPLWLAAACLRHRAVSVA